jgi:hypothetical protein
MNRYAIALDWCHRMADRERARDEPPPALQHAHAREGDVRSRGSVRSGRAVRLRADGLRPLAPRLRQDLDPVRLPRPPPAGLRLRRHVRAEHHRRGRRDHPPGARAGDRRVRPRSQIRARVFGRHACAAQRLRGRVRAPATTSTKWSARSSACRRRARPTPRQALGRQPPRPDVHVAARVGLAHHASRTRRDCDVCIVAPYSPLTGEDLAARRALIVTVRRRARRTRAPSASRDRGRSCTPRTRPELRGAARASSGRRRPGRRSRVRTTRHTRPLSRLCGGCRSLCSCENGVAGSPGPRP